MKAPPISRPARILCLEDNLADQELLEHTLASDGLACEFVHATCQKEFEDALTQAPFDLIISDFGLPAYNGMAALATARDVQANTPFVFVSGTIGEERAVESLRNGATDYVLKDRRDRLVSAVRRALRESQERADRRHAEEQVRIQATALEAAANGIFITDKNGKILSANKAFCTASGHALEEVMGKTPAFLKSGKHPPEFYRDLWRTVLSGRVWRSEVTNRRKDGTRYDEEVTITPVHDSSGQISHFIAVTQDMTKRKQLEEQLRQSQKMEAIGQLAGGVAHDFNNLLTIILCNSSAALSGPGQIDDETRECLKQVSAASLRAADLTRQLLTFSRKQAMQLQPLDLNDVLGPLAKMLKRIIGENIQLSCPHGDSPAFVQADAGMMEQVIFNLAVNARDAMPHGGQLVMAAKNINIDELQVEAHSEARAGGFVLLSVSDTGTGIAPEHLSRIFEPFFTTKEVGKGTGLGLATVYGIVKQHRGWIEVCSRPGAGTTFKIYLPSIPAPALDIGSINSIPALNGGTEKILLVEDDFAVRSLARRTLKSSGYHVVEAATGDEALKIWKDRTEDIDMLVSDVVLPGPLNGCELADQLVGEKPSLKVLLVSGYSPGAIGNGANPLERQHDFFLQKPFPPQALIDTVRHCLDGKTALAPAV